MNPESTRGLTIVIPAFNEEEGIGGVVDRLHEIMQKSNCSYEIIVVDDGSEDNTQEALQGKSLKLLQHETNRGYGAALKTGIISSRYQHIAIMDADGTYEEEALLRMIEHMDDYDMVVGSRTGADVNIPWLRRPPKWILNKFANFMTETKIPDLNSGLRIFDKAVARKFFSILPQNFSFTTTITVAMLTNGYLVKYIPINYKKRKGKSKIRPLQDTINFFALIVRTTLYFAPLKVFIPLSLFIIGSSLVKLVVIDIYLIQNLTESTMLIFATGIQVGMLGLLADLIDKRSAPTGKGEDP